MQALLDGKSCFSHTNASNFRQPLESLLLRYTALSACPNKIFQKWLFSCLPKVDHVIKSGKELIQMNCLIRDGPLEKLWGGRGIFEPQEFFFVIKFVV